MKKILAMGIAALSLALICEQQASAWCNWKFGAGINFNYQSGGNNVLWGAFRNGQPPAPDCCPPGCPPGVAPGCAPGFRGGYPGFPPYGPGEFQYFGAQQRPQGGDVGQLPPTTPSTSGYGAYRPISYAPNAYSYYPNYAYTPSYWYGR
jgi:hypothetical protein